MNMFRDFVLVPFLFIDLGLWIVISPAVAFYGADARLFTAPLLLSSVLIVAFFWNAVSALNSDNKTKGDRQ